MEKTDVPQSGSADILCAQILRDAGKEADEILAKAEAQAARILNENDAVVAELRREAMNAVYAQAMVVERRILATVDLGKRRILLEARERLFELVMERIKALAVEFRSSPQYPGYLQRMIVEGALALDPGEVVVVAAACDQTLLPRALFDGIERELMEKHSQRTSLILELDDKGTDIGVVVRSRDRRMECNNTFQARLARIHDEVRAEILKEVFGDNV